MQWGWRIPFLVSAALIAVALYVRFNIDETPVFARERADEKTRLGPAETPIAQVLRRQRREIVLAAGSAVCCFGYVYLASTYLASYAQTRLGYSRGSILFDSVLGGLLCIVFTALSSALCDQLGRRRVLLAGWAVALPWSLLVMPLIDSGSPSLFAVAVVGMYAIGGFGFGPTASFIPELFATSYRYTGSALAANLAGVAGGALPPVIAGALVATYGSWAIGVMLAILALISLVCTYRLPETAGSALVSR